MLPKKRQRGDERGDNSAPPPLGFSSMQDPFELAAKLQAVGYECLPNIAIQLCLFLNTPVSRVRAILLEGPSGAGKSFLAKCLAKITGAELLCLSCYNGMPTQNLIEAPSTLALAAAMAGGGSTDSGSAELLNLGILSRAFLRSQEGPVILLVDELDKPDAAIDTFFLGPLQDGRIWLESRPPIDADLDNIIVMFTKNYNRKIDDALLRRCHPLTMGYLTAELETKILSEYCHPTLVENLVAIADRMRNNHGSYGFDRPPAPEELLLAGHYVMRLLQWGITDPVYIAQSIWNIVSKSEHDRAVLDHMMRFHPDFANDLDINAKHLPVKEVYNRFGRAVLKGVIPLPQIETAAEGESVEADLESTNQSYQPLSLAVVEAAANPWAPFAEDNQ